MLETKEKIIGDPIEEKKLENTPFRSGCPFDEGIENCDHTLDDCLICPQYRKHKEEED